GEDGEWQARAESERGQRPSRRSVCTGRERTLRRDVREAAGLQPAAWLGGVGRPVEGAGGLGAEAGFGVVAGEISIGDGGHTPAGETATPPRGKRQPADEGVGRGETDGA